MNMSFRAGLATAVLVLSVGAASASTVRPFGVALGDAGRTLVTIDDLNQPSLVTGVGLTDGTGSVALDAITFRPQTNEFFGYQTASNTVFMVNRMSGIVSPVASTADGVSGAAVGFDFNNAIDAARVVSANGDNLVFFPNNDPPNIDRFTPLFYETGDVNEGAEPRVFANAYTNQVPDASANQQFVIDAGNSVLATLGNNAGNLATVGEIRVDGIRLEFSEIGGFDIFSLVEGDNTAYALLNTAGVSGLYLLDLFAGDDGGVQATFLGAAGGEFGPLSGLAIAPIPLPAGLWLLGAGLAGLGLVRARRGRAAV